MIESFSCKRTEALFIQLRASGFPHEIVERARGCLRLLDAATSLLDIKHTPGLRLEKLKGNRKGQYSVRINDQWRVCFVWKNAGVHQVEIIDYH